MVHANEKNRKQSQWKNKNNKNNQRAKCIIWKIRFVVQDNNDDDYDNDDDDDNNSEYDNVLTLNRARILKNSA